MNHAHSAACHIPGKSHKKEARLCSGGLHAKRGDRGPHSQSAMLSIGNPEWPVKKNGALPDTLHRRADHWRSLAPADQTGLKGYGVTTPVKDSGSPPPPFADSQSAFNQTWLPRAALKMPNPRGGAAACRPLKRNRGKQATAVRGQTSDPAGRQCAELIYLLNRPGWVSQYQKIPESGWIRHYRARPRRFCVAGKPFLRYDARGTPLPNEGHISGRVS